MSVTLTDADTQIDVIHYATTLRKYNKTEETLGLLLVCFTSSVNSIALHKSEKRNDWVKTLQYVYNGDQAIDSCNQTPQTNTRIDRWDP